MDEGRVVVYDLEGKEWQVEVDTTTDVVAFAKSLLVEGASATAKLAEGHFVMIPAHAIVRVEVMTAEAMVARFDSRSAARLAKESAG